MELVLCVVKEEVQPPSVLTKLRQNYVFYPLYQWLGVYHSLEHFKVNYYRRKLTQNRQILQSIIFTAGTKVMPVRSLVVYD